LKIADIVRDEYLLDEVKEVAGQLLKNKPKSVDRLIERWIGSSQKFVNIG